MVFVPRAARLNCVPHDLFRVDPGLYSLAAEPKRFCRNAAGLLHPLDFLCHFYRDHPLSSKAAGMGRLASYPFFSGYLPLPAALRRVIVGQWLGLLMIYRRK